MTCRATRRERVLVSRAVHPHYRADARDVRRRRGLDVDEIPLVADGPAAGTTDLDALERLLADADAPGRGRARRPAELPRPARADGGDRRGWRTPPARCSWPSSSRSRWPSSRRPARTAPTSPRARASRSGSRRSTAGRTSGILACTDALVRQIPGRLVGHDDRPRGQARVRDDAARARAGHPAREGGQQHLHEPDAARARREHLRSRRSGRTGCATSRRSGAARAAELEAALAAVGVAARPPRARTSTSSPSASRTRRPSIAGCSTAASSPASSLADAAARRADRSPTRCSCARPR